MPPQDGLFLEQRQSLKLYVPILQSWDRRGKHSPAFLVRGAQVWLPARRMGACWWWGSVAKERCGDTGGEEQRLVKSIIPVSSSFLNSSSRFPALLNKPLAPQ